MTATDQLSGTAKIARHARAVASLLSALPDSIETPTHIHVQHYLRQPEVMWLIFGDNQANQRERAAAIVRGIGGHWDKQPGDLFRGDLFRFETERNGVQLNITVDRAQVCERVVTGTREVTKSLPDPDAPMVQVTETVEDVEWVCAPLLAGASS